MDTKSSLIGTELGSYAGSTADWTSLVSKEIGTAAQNDARTAFLEARVRVLVVEDDKKLGNTVQSGIELAGGSVVRAETVEDALPLLLRGSFDVVLLDLVLPGRSGLQLLSWMRTHRVDTPVLVLSGRDTISDRILGLETGADDYLVKPFAFPELLARIRVLVRRHKPVPCKYLKCADLEINAKTHVATRAGSPLVLTCREFEILEYLCHNKGSIVTREMLARDIWKEPNRYTPIDNVINVHIAHLRQKVDGNSSQKLLHTVRRMGFVLREQAA